MKHITRDRRLTPEEAAKYNKIREQVAAELPELIARHHERTAAREAKQKTRSIPSVSVTYAQDGSSMRSNALGMRPMQERAYGRPDRRLRVVYDNGTESDLLVRSLQRALYKDKASRRIVDSGPGPLFSDVEEEGDLASGYIYVLRSKSDHPFVAQNRDVIHKIGVTRGDVKNRVANARKDPTYLLADVEIVATFKLANVHGNAFEALLHKFFGNARLDLELKDRFGAQVEPREWFLVPLAVIDEAIQKLMNGTLGSFQYDRDTARLIPA